MIREQELSAYLNGIEPTDKMAQAQAKNRLDQLVKPLGSLGVLEELAAKLAGIFGSPDYYGRFGFVPASRHGITLPDGSSMDAFMALPLYPGALDGVLGVFREDAAFGGIRDEAVDAYDEAFPPKVKMKLPGQIF